MTTHGFARVSTDGQTLDAQLAALKAAGAEKVYSEKQSGAKTDRAALSRALAWVGRLDKKRTGCGVSCDPAPEGPEEIFLGNQSGLRADLLVRFVITDLGRATVGGLGGPCHEMVQRKSVTLSHA
jgi:hypothetical protein